MPETAVKTREQIAADQIQFILRQDWFQPETLKKYIGALKNWQPNQLSVIIDGQIISYNRIVADLQRFLRSLPPDRRQNLATDGLAPDQLDSLESIIDEVAGSAATAEAAQPTSPNVPPNLRELTQIYQSAIEAKAKRENLTKPQIDEYIAKQITPVIIQTGVVKQAAKIQFEFVIDNSQYLENLAASLGRKPEVVKRLAKMRLDQIIDKTITTQALIQARSISADSSQLTSMFVRNLQKGFDFDDLVGPAIRTNRQNAKKAIESIKKTVTDETAKAQPAIEAAAKNLQEHPTVAAVARRTAQEAVKQVKPDIPPAKAARLNSQLVKHQNSPHIQEKLIAKTLNVPPTQAKLILNSLRPSLSQLAASTKKLNPLLAADPDGIAADALRHPHLFPKPFVDAIKSGKITDAQVAEIFQISRLLGVPTNAVILSRFGVNAQNLAANLQAGKKWLGIIPMGHGVDPKDATIAKLSDLAAAQKQLTDSLENPPPLLPPQTTEQFLKTAARNSRANRFSEFFDQINLFRLPSAVSYNLGRIPPLGSIGNSGSAFVSGLRVQSGFFNTVSNVMGYFNNTVGQAPSLLTAPFRAVGSAISNTIINPVKTWANTQIKSGLARAGAWLAKKGITEGAKKVGMALLGKGGATLLAQAVPVAGQIAGALMLLSTLGDIGKFLWEHKDKVGMFLGGMFLWGQMLLGNLIHLVSSLGTLGLTTGIGALLGTIFIPIPFVGTAIGAGLGFGAGLMINAAGGLGAALSGLGSALGSAAASLSSFIGTLTAPSLVAGLGGTLAAVGLGGLGLTAALVIFFIQPTINSALFVPAGKETIVGERRPAENWGCPLDSPRITTTSYDTASQTGHGSNQYWGAVTVCSHAGLPVGCSQEEEKIAWCRYSLPQSIGCIAPDSNGAGSECSLNFDQYAQQFESKKGYPASRCSSYGFAIDIISQTGSVEVFMPGIDGEETTWIYSQSFENPGAGWSHIYNSGIYTLILTHLEKDVVTAEVPAGTPIGNLFDMGTNTHLHLEFAIDGVYQRPEDYFCGGG